MKLLAIELSRLTVLFNMTRLSGQAYLPHMASALVERYSFAGAPRSFEELNADRVDFEHGQFEGFAINLEVYKDGMIVSSRSSTDLLDRFLDDLLHWAESDFEMSIVPTRAVDRIHESTVIVHADEALLAPLEALEGLTQSIRAIVKQNSGLDLPFHPLGYAFSVDPSMNPEIKPTAFRIERRFAAEFQLNQFVCIAPLRTAQHIDVLKTLEAALLHPKATLMKP